jgi:hypothetical protein
LKIEKAFVNVEGPKATQNKKVKNEKETKQKLMDKQMYRSKKSEERKGNRDGRKTGGTEKRRRRTTILLRLSCYFPNVIIFKFGPFLPSFSSSSSS